MVNLVSTMLAAAITSTATPATPTTAGGADAGVEPAPPVVPPEPRGTPFGVYVAAGGSVINPALAASVGFRYRLANHLLFGVDVEFNPWLAREAGELRAGALNAYGTLILRFPLKFQKVNLRSTLHAGASRLLFDLYGAPAGSTGPYVGVNFLGIDYELGKQVYLVVDPADIAIPIPQTTGTPFAFPQYRVTVGLQWGA